jgi:F-type H+-transporting ATPase subunit c
MWVVITAGFAMAIASAMCGMAQGKAISAACEGLARNPGAAPAIRFALILGLALIESLAIYTLVIIFAVVAPQAG